MENNTIYTKLSKIQVELKAPKNLFNAFGNYKYRNAESILEALKPLLKETNTCCILEDDIQVIGDRYYVVATASLIDCETKERISTKAFARESAERKGLDTSQITGATSSYARKVSLGALFLLDDTKDPDTEELKEEADNKEVGKKVSPITQDTLNAAYNAGIQLKDLATYFKKTIGQLTNEDVLWAINKKMKKVGEQ